MPTVTLNDEAPLGPNDFRIELEDETIERLAAIAAQNGQTLEGLVLDVIFARAESDTVPAGLALGAGKQTSL